MIDARNANIGDLVITDYSGTDTAHHIVKRQLGQSQTGVMFLVAPAVPRSSGGWIDSAWFRLVQRGL